jgi:hypothetical protein
MPMRALFALLLLLWSPAAFAQAVPWRVTEAAGQVEVRRGAQLAAARRGAVVAPGDLVTTGANGRAVLVRGRDFVIVSPRTQLRVPGAQEEQGGVIRMLQTSGRAQYRIERQAAPHFGVRTPHLVALVKGTVFTVDVSEDGATVAVTEGRVEVATLSGEMRQMVEPGFAAGVLAADPDRLTHARSADPRAESSANRVSNRGGASAEHRRDGRNRERGERPRLAYGELGSGNRELAGDDGQDRRAREARRSFDEAVRNHESNAGGNGNAGSSGNAGGDVSNGNGGSNLPDPGAPSAGAGQGPAQPGGGGSSGSHSGSGSSDSSSGPGGGAPNVTVPALDAVTAPVTAPVTEAVAPVTSPVIETVAPVTAPVIQAIAPVTAPVIETVAPVTAPVIEAVAPVTAPVIEAVAPVTAPVMETGIAPVLAPVLAPVTAPAPVTVPPAAPSSPATDPSRCLLGLVCL